MKTVMLCAAIALSVCPVLASPGLEAVAEAPAELPPEEAARAEEQGRRMVEDDRRFQPEELPEVAPPANGSHIAALGDALRRLRKYAGARYPVAPWMSRALLRLDIDGDGAADSALQVSSRDGMKSGLAVLLGGGGLLVVGAGQDMGLGEDLLDYDAWSVADRDGRDCLELRGEEALAVVCMGPDGLDAEVLR